jgi:thioredoxin-related protein
MSLLKYCLFTLLLLGCTKPEAQDIHWMTWEEAVAANTKQPKKIFVDVYTDWCGWCKKMDVSTFKEPAIVDMMNKNFYAVKLNAEQKESIVWQNQEFKWMPGGRNGAHKLAYELLDGQFSFPSFVMLDSEFKRIAISPGYKQGEALLKELRYASEEVYKTTPWDKYMSGTN